MQTTIYSDGKEYPVIFKPGRARSRSRSRASTIAARGFEIVDAPGGKKWPGGVTVWLSDDDRRIPVRIEIQQSLASLAARPAEDRVLRRAQVADALRQTLSEWSRAHWQCGA